MLRGFSNETDMQHKLQFFDEQEAPNWPLSRDPDKVGRTCKKLCNFNEWCSKIHSQLLLCFDEQLSMPGKEVMTDNSTNESCSSIEKSAAARIELCNNLNWNTMSFLTGVMDFVYRFFRISALESLKPPSRLCNFVKHPVRVTFQDHMTFLSDVFGFGSTIGEISSQCT